MAAYTPTDIKIKRSDGGLTIEASFKLNYEHVTRSTREPHLIKQLIHFYVDGKEMVSEEMSLVGGKKHRFQIEGLDCIFTVPSMLVPTIGRLDVAGYKVFDKLSPDTP